MKKSQAMSALAAVLAVSAMAASVSAADYAQDPSFVLPDIGGFKAGNASESPAPSADSSSSTSAKVSTVISDRSVTQAIKKGTTIKASYKQASIKASAVATLAKTEGAVLKLSTARYNISISADSVTDAKDIDLGMKITKDSKKGALIIRTNQSGDYGCTVTMSVPAKIYEQAGVDLSKAAVYSIDTASKTVVKISDVEVDGDGNIVIDLTAGGTYVIL